MMLSSILAVAISYGIAESSVPIDSAFPVLPLTEAPQRVSVCIGASIAKRPVVAFLFRRDGASYVRIAIIAVQTVTNSSGCPESQSEIPLPSLQSNTSYVVGLYTVPPTQKGDALNHAATSGNPERLQPVTYFGISTAR